MNGLFFDFENNDIVIQDDGSFAASNIDSQCCALIATSQVCRLTKPHIGEQLAVKLMNRKNANVTRDIEKAKKAVRDDGGKDVSIVISEEGQLSFNAVYES